MGQRIKFIASYDFDSNKEQNRINVLSSANKINYMICVLNELGYGVDVISTSFTLNHSCYRGKIIENGNNSLRLFPTTWRGGILLKILNLIVMRICIFLYLIRNVHKGEKVILYHSVAHLWINRLFNIMGVNVIEECEEIYGDIFGKPRMAYKEKKILRGCYAYIYPTKLLNSIVNTKGAPYLVIHGAYKDVGDKYFNSKISEEPTLSDKSKYHIAYTGILDPKKGCIDVVKAAEYLDDTYYIHVLGFGSQDELDELNKEIQEIKTKTTCLVSYDGLRKGEAYSLYLTKVNLGVCTLNTDQGFVNTQFPSKIISYMAAGVPVLCSSVDAIKTSDVAEAITFYEGNGPRDIANGIVEARKKGLIDAKKLLNDCHVRFKKEIYELIK